MAKGRMPTLSIVEDLKILKHIGFGLYSSRVVSPVHPLPFEGGKETFGHGIIEAILCATHTAYNPMFSESLLEIRAGILGAAMAVMHEVGNGSPTAQGHVKSI